MDQKALSGGKIRRYGGAPPSLSPARDEEPESQRGKSDGGALPKNRGLPAVDVLAARLDQHATRTGTGHGHDGHQAERYLTVHTGLHDPARLRGVSRSTELRGLTGRGASAHYIG